MIFTEARFLVFFMLTFVVSWSLRWHRARKLWLLICSYVFYGAWDERFLLLIAASTLIDWGIGLALGAARAPTRRKLLLALSLTANLGLLGVFKYYDFFARSGAALLTWLGLDASPEVLDLILPVGISFYTFQTLSYSIDVYRERLTPHRSLLDFALFVGFFPQLVAGPIVRAVDFLPQLATRPRFRDVAVRSHLTLFLLGFVKKACVSDNVARVADGVFSDPAAFDAGAHWLAGALYTIQIYCDFSGYSDMAIASAGLLGYALPLNFDHPYVAPSITNFWRRWHISLSSWFRDYLYVPLGGNRGGQTATLRNLVIVFVLCGLWHGAAWTFLVWGLYHGLFLVLERLGLGRSLERLPFGLAHVYTLLVVLMGWIVFRAPDLARAGEFLTGLLPGEGAAEQSILRPELWWLGVAAFGLAHVAMSRRWLAGLGRMPDWLYAVAWPVSASFALLWVSPEYQPFIYFQF